MGAKYDNWHEIRMQPTIQPTRSSTITGETLYTFAGFTKLDGRIKLRVGGGVRQGKTPDRNWVENKIDARTEAYKAAAGDEQTAVIVLFPLPEPATQQDIVKMLSNINYIARLDVDAYEFIRDRFSPEEIKRACAAGV